MSKFNDTYLKPALESLTGNAEFFVKKSHSTINRLNAESDSITKKAAADILTDRAVEALKNGY